MNATTNALASSIMKIFEEESVKPLSTRQEVIDLIGKEIQDALLSPQIAVYGEWQLCPKCSGHKKIQNLDFGKYNTSAAQPLTIDCDICNGAGIIAKPIIKP